jgi:hypothetical protein
VDKQAHRLFVYVYQISSHHVLPGLVLPQTRMDTRQAHGSHGSAAHKLSTVTGRSVTDLLHRHARAHTCTLALGLVLGKGRGLVFGPAPARPYCAALVREDGRCCALCVLYVCFVTVIVTVAVTAYPRLCDCLLCRLGLDQLGGVGGLCCCGGAKR